VHGRILKQYRVSHASPLLSRSCFVSYRSAALATLDFKSWLLSLSYYSFRALHSLGAEICHHHSSDCGCQHVFPSHDPRYFDLQQCCYVGRVPQDISSCFAKKANYLQTSIRQTVRPSTLKGAGGSHVDCVFRHLDPSYLCLRPANYCV
jgi:hypothetical protein